MKYALAAIIPVLLFLAALPRTADAGLLRLTGIRSNVLRSPSDMELAPSANFAQLETMREGGHQPQIEGDVKVWDETTKLDVGTSVAIATCWVMMLMSMPAWIRYLSGQPFTKTQWILAGVMWGAVFGGMYLFTHVVEFQSAHFREVRVLTLVECVYLMSQVITTVGYGDITPAHPKGQVFVGMYVLCSLFVIAMLVSDMVALIMSTVQQFQEKLLKREHVEVNYNLKGKAKANAASARKKGKTSIAAKAEKPPFSPVIYSFSIYAIFATTWILFFHYYPGEGKTWLQAIYMSVITLSTVGFGAFTPNTTWGMVFASFWMIFGSAALVSVVTSFTDYTMKMQEYERFDEDATKKALEEYKAKHTNGEMTETQFIRFTIMQKGIASEGEVNAVLANFHVLADGESGDKTVNLDKLAESAETA